MTFWTRSKRRICRWWNTEWVRVCHEDVPTLTDAAAALARIDQELSDAVDREMLHQQQHRILALGDGKISLPAVGLDILISANRYDVSVYEGRIEIKATTQKKKR